MRPRLIHIFVVAAVCCGVATESLAQPTPIRLRARTFVPPANVEPRLPAGRPSAPSVAAVPREFRGHRLIQFSRAIDAAALAALARAGAVPLRYVPDNTVAAAVRDGFDPAAVEGVRWVGELEPVDKVSSETAADLSRPAQSHPLTVVEFHPDVERQAAERIIDGAGTRALPALGLPPYIAVIPTDALAIQRLAENDAVAWLYPAAADLDARRRAMCEGVARAEGLVANYAAEGDGWDGPGRGTARLTYYLSRPSADLDVETQLREITRAMLEWSRHAAISWEPGASSSDPGSVHLLWGAEEHGDEFPFGPGVLAHAYYPAPPNPEPVAGDVHFNDTMPWGAGDPQRVDVFSVTLHEIGHTLGLVHSADPDAVMYPVYGGIVTTLTAPDIAAIREIYASVGPGALPLGWESEVVGSDTSGGAAHDDGRFHVSAGGRDIWGHADEFRFVWQPLTGNGDIVARLDAVSGPHRWTKAGVMIRGAAASAAPHAMALASPRERLAFQRRRTDGALSLHTRAGSAAVPVWLWLSRRGPRVEAYAADEGGEWRLLGFDTIDLGREVLAGLAVTSHQRDVTASATFSNVTVAPLAEPGWMSADIGDVGLAGGFAVRGSRLRVRGAGDDIWGQSDAFHFLWQSVTGDAEIVARVASVRHTRAWAKAGVMIRGGLDRSAPHAFMLTSAARGLAFQRRIEPGGDTLHTPGGQDVTPVWLKLSRRGDLLLAWRSTDGQRWVFVGSEKVPMGGLVFVGVAVSSHTRHALGEAVFDHVSVTGSGVQDP